MTKNANHERFNQYPKGSILFFQTICDDCTNSEKEIIKIFKTIFTHRKDIGNEYFEGDYKIMIDIIYLTIKNEKEELNKIQESCKKEEETDEYEDIEYNDDEYKPITYTIKTYEEWIKFNEISRIVITNKKGEGYLKFEGQLWRKLYDKNSLDFDEDCMEDLVGYIKHCQPDVLKMVKPQNELITWREYLSFTGKYRNILTNENITSFEYEKLHTKEKETYIFFKDKTYEFINNVEYDVDKILQDTINKCYTKTYEFYNLPYHEYIMPVSNGSKQTSYTIFNSLNLTFTPVDDLINDKILTNKYNGSRFILAKDIIDTDIVDNILLSLIDNETKENYKKLLYNLIVKQEEKQIIFYDYNEMLLTTWMNDLLYTISDHKFYCASWSYYENKKEFKKSLKINKLRYVLVSNHCVKVPIETQIKDFCRLGIKNIIVYQKDKTNNMYNIEKFRKYLDVESKEALIKCIKDENNYNITSESWKNEIQPNDRIFYSSDLLLTNFLKWCCLK